MPCKELIEKVARALYRSDHGNEFGFHLKDVAKVYSSNAEAAISTIFTALQEPNEVMLKRGLWYADEPAKAWREMLARSPLGEQSE